MASVFNIGWASVQISNMSVVNSLTYSTQRRDLLVASRNTFTSVANIFVLTLSLILFAIHGLAPVNQFRILGITICIVGVISSLFYIFVLKEPYLVQEAKRL